jgi:hypothetical protein
MDMLTDDEKSKLGNLPIDDRKIQAPNWHEIEDLLDFADKLKTKCDDVSDRIFLLDTIQIFLLLVFIGAIVFIGNFFAKYNISLLNIADIIISHPFGLFLLGLFSISVFSETSLRKLRRRIKSDRRALDSIVDLLRENHNLMTENFSELQKIQLKIKLSRFEIISPIKKPIYLRLLELVRLPSKLFAAVVSMVLILISSIFYNK